MTRRDKRRFNHPLKIDVILCFPYEVASVIFSEKFWSGALAEWLFYRAHAQEGAGKISEVMSVRTAA